MDRDSPKLLVIAEQNLTPKLSDYALKVAIRLDLEIIVLFCLEKGVHDPGRRQPLDQMDQTRYTGEPDTRQHNTMYRYSDEYSGIGSGDGKKMFEHQAADFAAKAWKVGVKVSTVVDVGGKEQAIAKIRGRETEIHFLLLNTKEVEQQNSTGSGQPILQVFR